MTTEPIITITVAVTDSGDWLTNVAFHALAQKYPPEDIVEAIYDAADEVEQAFDEQDQP